MNTSAVAAVKQAYAASARAVGAGLTRVGWLPDEPPAQSQRAKHWAYSLTCAHDSIALARLGVPWWTYSAIDAVDRFLSRRPGRVRVFEWGSGASTLWLAARATSVDSVEHHRGFGEMMTAELVAVDPPAAVSLQIVEPVSSKHPVVASRKEGHAELDFADYVNRINSIGGPFDLIVIDGRARAACLDAAIDHLGANGLIVFDNSRRRRYRDAIETSGLHETVYRGLTPTLPYPEQTSLLWPINEIAR